MQKIKVQIAQTVLSFDPSGAFEERGKGTTGWVIMDCKTNKVIEFGEIKALDYTEVGEYWDAHIQLVRYYSKKYGEKIAVSIEEYILYAKQAKGHINSRMETSQLIGVLRHHCWSYGIYVRTRPATAAKTRFTDAIMEHSKYIKKVNKSTYKIGKNVVCVHIVDAYRHALYFNKFENKE